MKLNKLIFILLSLLLPIFTVKPVFAGFGISPAEIYNDHLKPGAVFEKEIVISRSEADEDLKVVIETELGEAESWVKFEPSKEFVFPKNEKRKTIKAVVTVPKNAETKNYQGILRIKASSLNSSGSGVSIVQGARMEVTLVTTSLNVNILNVKGVRIPDTDWQKNITLFANIENSGNTLLSPEKIILEIQNLNKEILETQEVTEIEKIDPNTTKELLVEFKNNLSSGEYFGIVKILSDNHEIYSNRIVFKIIGGGGSVPQDSSTKTSFINKFIDLVKNNKTESIAIVSVVTLPSLIGLIISKKSKKIILKKIFFVFTLFYLSISFVLIFNFHQKQLSNMAKPGDIGFVQGETTEVVPTTVQIPTNNSAPLVVNKNNDGYPLYRTPDVNSAIVYTAIEDEKLSVLEEIDGWFRVSTGNGTGGWLPKTSVKNSD